MHFVAPERQRSASLSDHLSTRADGVLVGEGPTELRHREFLGCRQRRTSLVAGRVNVCGVCSMGCRCFRAANDIMGTVVGSVVRQRCLGRYYARRPRRTQRLHGKVGDANRLRAAVSDSIAARPLPRGGAFQPCDLRVPPIAHDGRQASAESRFEFRHAVPTLPVRAVDAVSLDARGKVAKPAGLCQQDLHGLEAAALVLLKGVGHIERRVRVDALAAGAIVLDCPVAARIVALAAQAAREPRDISRSQPNVERMQD
mmetsp:Transcript_63435/g.183810  ORF Transcript_63435/g.183810 Transcript_63435/m.183810 type:complete len:257 (-) Transcript_63435:482-1252(-)